MSASLRVAGQGYFSRGNKKGGSHKQEYAGAHTWLTNDKGGSDRTKPGQSHTLMRAHGSVGMLISVR